MFLNVCRINLIGIQYGIEKALLLLPGHCLALEHPEKKQRSLLK